MTAVAVEFDVLSEEERANLQQTLGRNRLPEGALAQVKNVICVASGKGGVGKSTMTANLAAALAADGRAAGALDCDVYGYSIPRMLGVEGRPEVNEHRKIIPMEGPAGVKVMSIGFFVEPNAAVVWRGPMLHKAIQQFLEDVDWGELEYLLLDLPPGTGDVSMTLAQLLPQAKITIVTTPQPAAQSVARRAAEMAAKVDLEILGVIENMSGFTTPDGQRHSIFGEGGGQLLADELDVPLLGQVPLSEDLRAHADAGSPLVLERAQRPGRDRDRAGRARHRRGDAAGARRASVRAAGDGGRRARLGHRAQGRPELAGDPGDTWRAMATRIVRMSFDIEPRPRRRLEERIALRFPRLRVFLGKRVWRMPDTRLRRAIIRRAAKVLWEAFNRGDLESTFALYHPDCVSVWPAEFTAVGMPAGTVGHEERVREQQRVLDDCGRLPVRAARIHRPVRRAAVDRGADDRHGPAERRGGGHPVDRPRYDLRRPGRSRGALRRQREGARRCGSPSPGALRTSSSSSRYRGNWRPASNMPIQGLGR